MPPADKPPYVLLLACGSLSAVLACTWIAFSLHLNLASAGCLYLVLIVVTALYGGFAIATLSSIAAVTCLTYFFVPPVFSFTVNHPENWVALGAFEFTALTISRLSHRARASRGRSDGGTCRHGAALPDGAAAAGAGSCRGTGNSDPTGDPRGVCTLGRGAVRRFVRPRISAAVPPPPEPKSARAALYQRDTDDFDPATQPGFACSVWARVRWARWAWAAGACGRWLRRPSHPWRP